MKYLKRMLVFALFFPILALARDFYMDTYSSTISFKIKHVGFSYVNGEINARSAKASYNYEKNTFTDISTVLLTQSINTDNKKRDAALLSDEFLSAATHPLIKFNLISHNKENKNAKELLNGTLEIVGHKRPITLKINNQSLLDDGSILLELSGKINRLDYGIAPDIPSQALGRDIIIEAKVKFIPLNGKK